MEGYSHLIARPMQFPNHEVHIRAKHKSAVSQVKVCLKKILFKVLQSGGHFLLEDNLERKNEDEGIGMAGIRKVAFLTEPDFTERIIDSSGLFVERTIASSGL